MLTLALLWARGHLSRPSLAKLPQSSLLHNQLAPQLLKKLLQGTPTREGIDAAVPTREESAATTPPLSGGAGEEMRAPSPARVEELPVEARTSGTRPTFGRGQRRPRPWLGGAPRARRPRHTPTTNWRRSKGAPTMDASIFTSGVSVETTSLAMRRSPKSKRGREWSGPPRGLSTRLW